MRRSPQFAQLRITTTEGRSIDMDLAVDWREHEPVTLPLGPVLSVEDAVGSKVSALYTRNEARDYIDVDSIRASGRFTDAELMSAAMERDDGFEVGVFAQQLDRIQSIAPRRFEEYGVDADQFAALQTRFTSWAGELRGQVAGEATATENVRRFTEVDIPLRGSDLTQPPTTPSAKGYGQMRTERDDGLGG